MTFEIDSHIPPPETTPSLRGTIMALEAGQSFLVGPDFKYASIKSTASQIAKGWSRKFTIRKLPDGVRVWRLS